MSIIQGLFQDEKQLSIPFGIWWWCQDFLAEIGVTGCATPTEGLLPGVCCTIKSKGGRPLLRFFDPHGQKMARDQRDESLLFASADKRHGGATLLTYIL